MKTGVPFHQSHRWRHQYRVSKCFSCSHLSLHSQKTMLLILLNSYLIWYCCYFHKRVTADFTASAQRLKSWFPHHLKFLQAQSLESDCHLLQNLSPPLLHIIGCNLPLRLARSACLSETCTFHDCCHWQCQNYFIVPLRRTVPASEYQNFQCRPTLHFNLHPAELIFDLQPRAELRLVEIAMGLVVNFILHLRYVKFKAALFKLLLSCQVQTHSLKASLCLPKDSLRTLTSMF